MKKFIIGIMVLALVGLLMGNVYAGQKRYVQTNYVSQETTQFIPVKYVNKPVKMQNVVWTWTYTTPYIAPAAVAVYEPMPLVVYTPARRCLRPPCPFELLDRLLFGY
jgi:hypothetical protein